MADYTPNALRPNSFKSKEEAQEKKKPEPIVSTTPTVKKKTLGQKFMQTFIAEDIHSVRQAVVHDVLIPKIKDIVTNIINESVNRLFYGRPAASNQQAKSTVYYNMSNSMNKPVPRENKSVYDFDNLVYANQTDAENVLLKLKLEVEHYGHVSVGFYYDITGRDSEPTDYNYGWYNLKNSKPVSCAEGWMLQLPQPIPL